MYARACSQTWMTPRSTSWPRAETKALWKLGKHLVYTCRARLVANTPLCARKHTTCRKCARSFGTFHQFGTYLLHKLPYVPRTILLWDFWETIEVTALFPKFVVRVYTCRARLVANNPLCARKHTT